jgi:hypothetical protein
MRSRRFAVSAPDPVIVALWSSMEQHRVAGHRRGERHVCRRDENALLRLAAAGDEGDGPRREQCRDVAAVPSSIPMPGHGSFSVYFRQTA